ncbi:MAG TPA: siderophore-interacting protein [Mycobacterium sp.]|nr:siderophore-interacting protein [Mycobacterium sp.]
MSVPHQVRATARTYLLTVTAVRNVGPRMRRVTLSGDELADFSPWPGQDVVFHLSDEAGSGVRRRYTVRNLDRDARQFDVDFVLHGPGPGADWARLVRPGERVEVFGPRGKVPMSDASWQLFAGDESALPAIAEMVEALPAHARAVALVEVQDADDEQPVNPRAELDLRWLYRGTIGPGVATTLDEALASVKLPASDRHLFFFAESRIVRRLRDAASGRGVTASEISAKGYWNVGRASRDGGAG